VYNEVTRTAVTTLHTVSADVIALAALVLLLFAVCMARGKHTLLASMFALYPAALITANFPFYDRISSVANVHVATLTVFGVTTVVALIVIRSFLQHSYEQKTFWRLLEHFVLAVLAAGLLAALLFHVVGAAEHYTFSVLVHSLFASQTAYFLWLVAPMIVVPLYVRAS
jgi:RsiW-degrading membrane proteinase PrsW (M82 family)